MITKKVRDAFWCSTCRYDLRHKLMAIPGERTHHIMMIIVKLNWKNIFIATTDRIQAIDRGEIIVARTTRPIRTILLRKLIFLYYQLFTLIAQWWLSLLRWWSCKGEAININARIHKSIEKPFLFGSVKISKTCISNLRKRILLNHDIKSLGITPTLNMSGGAFNSHSSQNITQKRHFIFLFFLSFTFLLIIAAHKIPFSYIMDH